MISNLQRLVSFGVLSILFGIFIVSGTGLVHQSAIFKPIHRWGAHALLIAAIFVAILSSINMILDFRRRGFFISLAHAGFIGASLLLLLFAGFTGYLYPHDESHFVEETANRFFVLHMIVLPILTGSCLIGWYGTTLLKLRDSSNDSTK